MEKMEMKKNRNSDLDVYRGKKVLITGHTGFKGSWMSRWLHMLGADVYGFSLPPEGPVSLYQQLENDKIVHSELGDIRKSDEQKATGARG